MVEVGVGDVYQAIPRSVKPCGLERMVEILNVPALASAQRPNDLVSIVTLPVDHPPCADVLVRWRDQLYGLLRTSTGTGESELPGEIDVGFDTLQNRRVLRMAAAELDRLRPSADRLYEARVSLTQSSPYDSDQLAVCRYEAIPSDVCSASTAPQFRPRSFSSAPS